MPAAADIALWLAAISTTVGAAGYLGRKALRFLRIMEGLAKIIEHELTTDGGATMKDELHMVAVHVGNLEAQVSGLSERMMTLEALELLGYQRPNDTEG